MKEINLKFDLSRARNAEHYQFHTDMLGIITEDFAEKQSIAPLRSTYKQLLDIENECYLQNRTYKDTAAVEASDRKRDDHFLYVSQTITTGKLCPIEAKRKAAEELDYVIAPYRNAPRLNYASTRRLSAISLKKYANLNTPATLRLWDSTKHLPPSMRPIKNLTRFTPDVRPKPLAALPLKQ